MAPLMAGQMPVVVVPGGEFAVDLRDRPRQVAKNLATSAAFACIRLVLCCSKADRGILIGSLLQVNRYLHIGPPISTAPRVASSFAGRGAASAAS